jgi:tRNA(fMet)-specific endonuclease VapC
MVDTNICVAMLRQRSRNVGLKWAENAGAIFVSSIVASELYHGAMKSAWPVQNLVSVDALLSRVPILPFGTAAAARYGQIRADLERRGQPIGALDTLIAAHALAEGMTLVTNNRREFDRVAVLCVEDWFAP